MQRKEKEQKKYWQKKQDKWTTDDHADYLRDRFAEWFKK